MKKLKLLGCNEEPFNGKVFLIDQGRRRWIRSLEQIEKLKFKWPDDVCWVDSSKLLSIPLGPKIGALENKNKNKIFKKKSMETMRELCVSHVRGQGVEFGAAANPLPIPIGVKVNYADIVGGEVLEEELYSQEDNHEYVDTDIISSFDDMKGINDDSLDFIIASHVIEHVRNPIKSVNIAWDKLKKGGTLVLIVPKHKRTLDRHRTLTTLDHLIDDYNNPSKYKDLLHIAEFYSLAKPLSVTDLYKKMLQSIEGDYHSIHYHVWDEATFTHLLKYLIEQRPWKILINQKAFYGESNYEFYVVLEKPS